MYNKKTVFIGACMGILIFGMGIITLGSVKQSLSVRFGLDALGAGTLFSILPLGILAGSLLFGPACDKYGYKFILAGCCLSMFLGFEGMAFAPSWFLLRWSVFFFGLGGGAMNGASSALVSDLSEEKKGANLSILGVFFGLGALGMPMVLALLENAVRYNSIVALVGLFSFAVGLFCVCIHFPAPKQSSGFPVKEATQLLKNGGLLLIAFFLFCQSSLEAVINNWTTSYLMSIKAFTESEALYGLSLFVAGMTIMRLLLGSLLRNIRQPALWLIAFVLLGLGWLLFAYANSSITIMIALVCMGGGLAGGFPLMLGLVGNRFKNLSGTAFGIVLVIALTGNMLINYLVGIITQKYGIGHLPYVVGLEWIIMGLLCWRILRRSDSPS